MSVTIDAVPANAASLAEARAYLRLDGTDEDALLGRLIAASTALCEGFTGQVLLARAVVETVPVSADWRRLSLTPVGSITGLEGRSVTGENFTLAVDAYAVDIDAGGDGWVRVTSPGSAARADVHYRAGMADDWGGLPEAIRQGIVRLAAHMFSHRDDPDEAGPPAAVAALWRPWRRMRLR